MVSGSREAKYLSQDLTLVKRINGEFMKVEMNWADANRRLNLRLASGRMLPPNRRPIEARLAGQTTTHSATFEGRPIEIRL